MGASAHKVLKTHDRHASRVRARRAGMAFQARTGPARNRWRSFLAQESAATASLLVDVDPLLLKSLAGHFLESDGHWWQTDEGRAGRTNRGTEFSLCPRARQSCLPAVITDLGHANTWIGGARWASVIKAAAPERTPVVLLTGRGHDLQAINWPEYVVTYLASPRAGFAELRAALAGNCFLDTARSTASSANREKRTAAWPEQLPSQVTTNRAVLRMTTILPAPQACHAISMSFTVEPANQGGTPPSCWPRAKPRGPSVRHAPGSFPPACIGGLDGNQKVTM